MDWTPQGDRNRNMGNKQGKGGQAGNGSAQTQSNDTINGRKSPEQTSGHSMEVENEDQKSKQQEEQKVDKKERKDFHTFESNGFTYVVPKKYKFKRKLGQGAYGQVVKLANMETNPPTDLAVKRCDHMFDGSMTDAKRILREVKILRHLRHDNIIKLHDLFGPQDVKEDFHTVYIVMEFMQTDLRRVIYSRNELGDEHVQCIAYQILMGLKYLHSAKIWHRDLKPANILLNSDCTVKICDFGLSRGIEGAIDQTDYVVTRWYRAPEVMCSTKYGAGIDLWAVGCIVAELHGRKPLFKGENYKDQVCEIIRIMGVPEEKDFNAVIQNQHAHKYVTRYLRKLTDTKGKDLGDLYPNASDLAIALMSKLLKFNPEKRITVQGALEDDYFADIREPQAETVCPQIFDWSYEGATKTKKALQNEFRREFECWAATHANAHAMSNSVSNGYSNANSNGSSHNGSTRDDTAMRE